MPKFCSHRGKLGYSSAWRNLGKPFLYSSVDPSWNPRSPSPLSGCVMSLRRTHLEAQEAVWFGGLVASAWGNAKWMEKCLAVSSQVRVRALFIWVFSKNRNWLYWFFQQGHAASPKKSKVRISSVTSFQAALLLACLKYPALRVRWLCVMMNLLKCC